MECKFCGQPLDAGNSVCPHCGKDNAEEILTVETAPVQEVEETVETELPAEAVSQETVAEETVKPGFRMTPGKLTLIIVGAIALVAILVALVLKGADTNVSHTAATEPSMENATVGSEPLETAPPATIPADGNPDDVTCKGSYTVSDEEILALKDVVVATAGDYELRNADLQMFYWLQVQQFLGEYSYYLSYLGMDYTQPLDMQLCYMAETIMTWQQYFLDSALKTWQTYQALADAAQEQGVELSEEVRLELDTLKDTMTSEAELRGFESLDAYLAYNVGPGCTFEDYMAYLELYYQGYAFFDELYAQFDPTEAELEAFFDAHAADYEASGITKDGKFVDVRHVLIMPEGADGSNIRTETFSDEAWAWAENKAQELLNQWKSGEATEESFAQLANANSNDSDGTDGGLYTQVKQGQMVEAFDSWIFDETRQYGDTDIVKTEFGYHIMFFVSSQSQWQYYAETDYISEKVNEQIDAIVAEYPMNVEYAKIALGLVALQ